MKKFFVISLILGVSMLYTNVVSAKHWVYKSVPLVDAEVEELDTELEEYVSDGIVNDGGFKETADRRVKVTFEYQNQNSRIDGPGVVINVICSKLKLTWKGHKWVNAETNMQGELYCAFYYEYFDVDAGEWKYWVQKRKYTNIALSNSKNFRVILPAKIYEEYGSVRPVGIAVLKYKITTRSLGDDRPIIYEYGPEDLLEY